MDLFFLSLSASLALPPLLSNDLCFYVIKHVAWKNKTDQQSTLQNLTECLTHILNLIQLQSVRNS